MNEPLSPKYEAEIRARAEAATPGPWQEHREYGEHFYANVSGSYLRGVGTLNFGDGEDADADREFTIHAREDVPALLAEIDRLRARVAELERPAVEARRNEIRSTYTALISQAEQDRDFEGAATLTLQLRESEAKWVATDATELCRCGHSKERHAPDVYGAGTCGDCPGDEERSWRHPYTPASKGGA